MRDAKNSLIWSLYLRYERYLVTYPDKKKFLKNNWQLTRMRLDIFCNFNIVIFRSKDIISLSQLYNLIL